jgi:predicted DNA-binding transcriptional regulator AlpA
MNLETINVNEFAKILNIKPSSLRTRLCRHPDTLPRPIQGGKGMRLLWLKAVVEKWMMEGSKV